MINLQENKSESKKKGEKISSISLFVAFTASRFPNGASIFLTYSRIRALTAQSSGFILYNINDIAEKINLKPSTLRRHLEAMYKYGWAERKGKSLHIISQQRLRIDMLRMKLPYGEGGGKHDAVPVDELMEMSVAEWKGKIAAWTVALKLEQQAWARTHETREIGKKGQITKIAPNNGSIKKKFSLPGGRTLKMSRRLRTPKDGEYIDGIVAGYIQALILDKHHSTISRWEMIAQKKGWMEKRGTARRLPKENFMFWELEEIQRWWDKGAKGIPELAGKVFYTRSGELLVRLCLRRR